MNTKQTIAYRLRPTVLLFCGMLLLLAVSDSVRAQNKRKTTKPKAQTATVIVDQNGFQPSTLRLRRGVPARLTFVRRVENTCVTEVVFPDFGITRELPLNKAVTVKFTPLKKGEFVFTCGMNMMRDKLIVQ